VGASTHSFHSNPFLRRQFLKQLVGWALGGLALAHSSWSFANDLKNPVGYATISWPESEFDHALQTVAGLGFKGVQMLGWARDAFAAAKTWQLRERLEAAGLQPVTLSCSGLSLDPGNLTDVSGEFRSYANFFKNLNGKYLQMTDDGRPGAKYPPEQIEALGSALNKLGKIAQDGGLALGYHPHVGTLGETREGLGRVLDATDPRYVKLIADVAHLTLGGSDPAEVVSTYHERLLFCHFKDVRKDVSALYHKDPAAARRAKHTFTEVGTGVVNFPAILQAFRDTQFDGWVIVELDGYQRRPGGPDESARMNKAAIEKLGLQI
jgi:inosose dehydratase